MRSAFYVTTTLFITNSIRSAAESDQYGHQQMSHNNGVVPGTMNTESSTGRFLLSSGAQQDDWRPNVVDEERTPEASTRIIESSLTSLSKEMLDTIRKAAHLSMDLNAPPEETYTGALEAYNTLRNTNPRTYTASNPGVSSKHPSKRRSLDKASSSAISRNMSGRRPKKPRLNVPLRVTEAQGSIGQGKMMPTLRNFNQNDVDNVHKLYLEYLERNSAAFKPRQDETKKMLGLVNWRYNSRPAVGSVFKRDIEGLMRMNLKDLKKLFFGSKPVLESELEKLIQKPSEEYEEIQLCVLRLLSLKRLVRMYRNFFEFCLSNHAVCSNLDPKSTLQIELKVRENAKSGVNVATKSAMSETKKPGLTKVEYDMFENVVKAVKKANLSETDKKSTYKTVDEIYRDDDQLTPPNLAALIADDSTFQTGKRRFALNYDVFKTPPKSSTNEDLPPSKQGDISRDRKKLYGILKVATEGVSETKTRYDMNIVNEDEKAKYTELRKAFIEATEFHYTPTLEVTKKMLKMFNWEQSFDPRCSNVPGHHLKNDVSLMKKNDLMAGLGPEWVREITVATQKQPDADDEKVLLELKTEYLSILLDTYDNFYWFCSKHRSQCEIPNAEWFTARRTKVTRSRLRRKKSRAKDHQETS